MIIGPIEYEDCVATSDSLSGISLEKGKLYTVTIWTSGFESNEEVEGQIELRWKLGRVAVEGLSEEEFLAPAEPEVIDNLELLNLRSNSYKQIYSIVRAKLYALFGPDYAATEDPAAVTTEVIEYISKLDPQQAKSLARGLNFIDRYCRRRTGISLKRLHPRYVIEVLNQGESSSGHPIIPWDKNLWTWIRHTAISSISMIARMVVHSRPAGRQAVGFQWWEPCSNRNNLVPTNQLQKPAYPDLSESYDLCIVGSGAGGAVAAAIAAEAGLKVLIIERGDWVHPAALVETNPYESDPDMNAWPARADKALIQLYRRAGVNFAADISIWPPNCDRFDYEDQTFGPYGAALAFEPPQIVNVSQAEVVGGGPYINNALHLKVKQHVWETWEDYWSSIGVSAPCTYSELDRRMDQVNIDLGVNNDATSCCTGDDAAIFVAGCNEAGEHVEAMDVAIQEDTSQCSGRGGSGPSCIGSGSDNVVDPFGRHIGGLHPYNAGGPNSYLMRAIQAGAVVAYQTSAEKMLFTRTGRSVASVMLLDSHRGPGNECRVHLSADAYVLSAGAIGSTQLLQSSLAGTGLSLDGLGERLTANIGTPVYAVFEDPIRDISSGHPWPGIAQCYYVDEEPVGSVAKDYPTLENWFGYPGHLALAMTGWFKEYVDVMKKHNNISVCGMFVPTQPRSRNAVQADGSVIIELNDTEFELILKGMEKIGKIYFAAATKYRNPVSLYLPTRSILLDASNKPMRIRNMTALKKALSIVRSKGPAFLNLVTTHPQGGNAIGKVVGTENFEVIGLGNLHVIDASIYPKGCEINPQLTLKALATLAAERLVARLKARIP